MKTATLPPAKPSTSKPAKQITTGAQLAEALLEWRKLTTAKDRLEIAANIEGARRRMNNEHLH